MRRERFRFCFRSMASTPPWAKAARVAITVGRDIPICCAIALLAMPSAANRTTLHLRATFWGVLPARSSDSNRSLCLGLRGKALAGVNMPHYSMTLFLLSYLYMTGH